MVHKATPIIIPGESNELPGEIQHLASQCQELPLRQSSGSEPVFIINDPAIDSIIFERHVREAAASRYCSLPVDYPRQFYDQSQLINRECQDAIDLVHGAVRHYGVIDPPPPGSPWRVRLGYLFRRCMRFCFRVHLYQTRSLGLSLVAALEKLNRANVRLTQALEFEHQRSSVIEEENRRLAAQLAEVMTRDPY